MKCTISNTISTRKIGDDLFIFDRHLSKIHNLNKVGAYIWELLKQGSGKKEIIDNIIRRFEVDAKTAQQDFEEYLLKLQKKQLITIKNAQTDEARE